MLMATRPVPRDGWLVRWLNGCHRAQVYRLAIFVALPAGVSQWRFENRFSSGVAVIGEIKGDAIEAARLLMGIGEELH